MRTFRWLARLAGLLTLTWVWSTASLLLSGLVAVPAAGCCDCAGSYNQIRVALDTPVADFQVEGDGCGAFECDYFSGSLCRDYKVRLVKVGSCHLTGTTSDGRQASTDVTVTLLKTNCCGNIYTTGRTDLGPGYGSDTVKINFSTPGADAGADRG
jgi:hypothetical protein